jgi:hypothetical protein
VSGFNKPEIAHHMNARIAHTSAWEKPTVGDPKNNTPIKYVADHPDDIPVRTMYPHFSENGGHRDDSMDKMPDTMNTQPHT